MKSEKTSCAKYLKSDHPNWQGKKLDIGINKGKKSYTVVEDRRIDALGETNVTAKSYKSTDEKVNTPNRELDFRFQSPSFRPFVLFCFFLFFNLFFCLWRMFEERGL